MTNQQSQHVGPVIFSNGTARRQLVEEGEVITLRPDERTTGETWWRESRTGPKRGDCRIEGIDVVVPVWDNDLAPYVGRSGFDCVADWQDALRDLHGEMPGSCFAYRVVSLDGQ
jgi:hypothetical protein